MIKVTIEFPDAEVQQPPMVIECDTLNFESVNPTQAVTDEETGEVEYVNTGVLKRVLTLNTKVGTDDVD